MNLSNIFRSLGTGALLDTRTQEKKDKDYFFGEIVASASPVIWTEKPESQWRKFPVQDQNGSGSCVAQSLKKVAGINAWLRNGQYINFSASHIYQRRINKPAQGMMGVEAFDLWRNSLTLEELAPSEKKSDAQMDAEKVESHEDEVGKIFKLTNHIGIPEKDFETVASVIQTTSKGVMVWFYFTSNEWSRLVPEIQDLNLTVQTGLRHSVTAVDFTLNLGKRCLVIEDSAHFGGLSRRLITEDFYKARNFFARYPMAFKFAEGTVKPPYDGTIVSLQMCLRYEGFFPTNVEYIEKIGPVTTEAIRKFQVKYNISPPLGNFGPLTKAKVVELYG